MATEFDEVYIKSKLGIATGYPHPIFGAGVTIDKAGVNINGELNILPPTIGSPLPFLKHGVKIDTNGIFAGVISADTISVKPPYLPTMPPDTKKGVSIDKSGIHINTNLEVLAHRLSDPVEGLRIDEDGVSIFNKSLNIISVNVGQHVAGAEVVFAVNSDSGKVNVGGVEISGHDNEINVGSASMRQDGIWVDGYELKQQIDELKNRVTNLEQQKSAIDELKNRVTNLEQQKSALESIISELKADFICHCHSYFSPVYGGEENYTFCGRVTPPPYGPGSQIEIDNDNIVQLDDQDCPFCMKFGYLLRVDPGKDFNVYYIICPKCGGAQKFDK